MVQRKIGFPIPDRKIWENFFREPDEVRYKIGTHAFVIDAANLGNYTIVGTGFGLRSTKEKLCLGFNVIAWESPAGNAPAPALADPLNSTLLLQPVFGEGRQTAAGEPVGVQGFDGQTVQNAIGLNYASMHICPLCFTIGQPVVADPPILDYQETVIHSFQPMRGNDIIQFAYWAMNGAGHDLSVFIKSFFLEGQFKEGVIR